MPKRDTHGYLLIELMIAIALISSSGVFIGHLRGQIMVWHREATLYLKAVVLANSILDSKELHNLPQEDNISTSYDTSQPYTGIPFKFVTVNFVVKMGKNEKKFTFIGGAIDYKKEAA